MRTTARTEKRPALLVLDEYTGAPATLVLDVPKAVLYLIEGTSTERLRLHSETTIHLSLGGQLTIGSFQFTWVAERPWIEDESALMDFTDALVKAKQGRQRGRMDWPWRARRRTFRRFGMHRSFAIDSLCRPEETPVEIPV